MQRQGRQHPGARGVVVREDDEGARAVLERREIGLGEGAVAAEPGRGEVVGEQPAGGIGGFLAEDQDHRVFGMADELREVVERSGRGGHARAERGWAEAGRGVRARAPVGPREEGLPDGGVALRQVRVRDGVAGGVGDGIAVTVAVRPDVGRRAVLGMVERVAARRDRSGPAGERRRRPGGWGWRGLDGLCPEVDAVLQADGGDDVAVGAAGEAVEEDASTGGPGRDVEAGRGVVVRGAAHLEPAAGALGPGIKESGKVCRTECGHGWAV